MFSQDDFGNMTAFPLTWPIQQARTKRRGESRFKYGRSIYQAVEEVLNQVRMLDGKECAISSNLRIKQDGRPYSSQSAPGDPGVAIYFLVGKKPVVFACDKWSKVEDNLWAVAKHLEAMRGQERWGVGTREQAFTGYLALPAPEPWWRILDVEPEASPEEIQAAYRMLAKETHPDMGGDAGAFDRVRKAYEQAQEHGRK